MLESSVFSPHSPLRPPKQLAQGVELLEKYAHLNHWEALLAEGIAGLNGAPAIGRDGLRVREWLGTIKNGPGWRPLRMALSLSCR
jgi:hypothetical protein